MENEYGGGRLRGFSTLAIVIVDSERWCDGHIVVKWVGEEGFRRRGLLVWIAQKILEGECAQFEEV